MKLSRRQLRKIILNEIMQGGPEPIPGMIGIPSPGGFEIDKLVDKLGTGIGTGMSMASGLSDAVSKLSNGQSFSMNPGPAGPGLAAVAAGAGGLLSKLADPKVLLGIGVAIGIIILVGIALNYTITISASTSTSSERPGGIKDSDEKSMEVVFEAPSQAAAQA